MEMRGCQQIRQENMNTITNIQIDSNELSARRVLVTGGTKGISEAVVKRLRQAGAKVITTARSIPETLRSRNFSFNPTSAHLTGWKSCEEVQAFRWLGHLNQQCRQFFCAKRRSTCLE
jgi:hypothetical protein